MSTETVQHAPIVSDNGMPVADVQTPAREGHRVYIGNLSFSSTEEQVRELLAPFGGELIEVVLPMKGGSKRPGGFAIAAYKEEGPANKAVEGLNDKDVDGRKLRVQHARSEEESATRRKAAIERREAAKATKHQEQQEKAQGEGNTTEGGEQAAKPKKKRAPRNRRRGPGEEDEAEGEESAEPAAGTDGEAAAKPKRKPRTRKPKEARIDGEEGAATEATETTEKKPREKKARQPRMQSTGELSKTSIFVANLPFTVDDEQLAAIFTNLSINVKSAKVVKGLRKNRTDGKAFRASKGFGFVEVENAGQQQEAVDKVEGSLIGDRKITAKIANEMKPAEVDAVEGEGAAAEATA